MRFRAVRRRLRVALPGLMWVALAVQSGPATIANDRPLAEVLELSPDALKRFERLQDDWLEWLAAVYQGDVSRASVAVDRLLTGARELGMERLPDLSLGAAGRAIGFAREGRFDMASACLTAAEQFDPGRSESSFAAAKVARLDGRYPAAFWKTLEGYARLFTNRLLRYLWAADVGHWLLFILLTGGALYVAILMATRGGELFHDVLSFIERFAPGLLALVITLVLLIWPLVLPSGILWLVLYWSILLWAYGARSQRIVLVALWIVLGAVPMLINEQRQRIRVALAPTVLSIENLAAGRLQGSLFGDLAALRAALPTSGAVTHILADLHCQLGEWSSAQALYETLVESEPQNGSALLNLGVSSFHLGDQRRAMESFEKASETADGAAAGRFNLSQLLSELYRFRDAERELKIAQDLAPAKVKAWLQNAEETRVVMLSGGLERAAEIRQELVASWRPEKADSRWSALWPRVLSLPLAVAFLLIAAGLHFVVRRSSSAYAPAEKLAPAGSWRSALLPGLAEAEAGRPLIALLVVLFLVFLMSLPLVGELVYRLPWIYAPWTGAAATVAIAGLVLFLLVRLALWWRGAAA